MYALIMAARGDFSGFKMLNEVEVKNVKTADLHKNPSQLVPGDLEPLTKTDYGFFKSLVRAAVGATPGYKTVSGTPLEPLVPTVPASAAAVMSSSNRSITSSPTLTLTQNIHAAPGQDVQAIGEAAAKSSRDVWQGMIDDAQVGLLPLMPATAGAGGK
jgi:hypothetical protein